MHEPLAFGRNVAYEQMGVEITRQQDQLEEEQRRAPNRGRPAEPGKNELRDEGLNLKQKEGAEKDRNRVDQH